MAENRHRARKRFGQNFLVDRNIIARIIDAIDPQRDDNIVEIGPGLGALTGPLLERVGHLDVIELDRDVIPRLVENCGDSQHLTVHQADVLKFDFASLVEDSKLRVIGNLPYNISTPVLFHLLGYHADIRDMVFMLQKEVVERITASRGDKSYGRLTVMMQTWFDTEHLFDVAARCFSPAPKVESAIIRLTPSNRHCTNISDTGSYETLVRQAFSQRRKTLRNTLKPLCTTDAIESAGIDPGIRAEQLRVDDFLALYQVLLQQH